MRWLLLVALATACDPVAPRAQWVVTVGTDATVPQLGDRVLIDVHYGTEEPCVGCRRQFGIERAPIFSFGVVPDGDQMTPLVRARLYRADHTGTDGLPSGTALLDVAALLPPTRVPLRVALPLPMDCFGLPVSITRGESCDPLSRRYAAYAFLPEGDQVPVAGSWEAAQPVSCGKVPPDGMVCIPGGVFLLGGVGGFVVLDRFAPRPERLVRVSPFALDTDELTVGTFRALRREGRVTEEPLRRVADEMATFSACTWLGPDDDSNDEMPLNCIGHSLARQVCEALGKRLPTEAEWEFTAGNGADESPYPWGDDNDVCCRAVVARGRFNFGVQSKEHVACLSQCGTLPAGLVAGGAETDRTRLGVRNLGGNLSEWVEDAFAGYDEPCWSGGQLLPDPVCGGSFTKSIRGGAWTIPAVFAEVITREAAPSQTVRVDLGFRCALSLPP